MKPMVECLGSHDITIQWSAMRALEQVELGNTLTVVSQWEESSKSVAAPFKEETPRTYIPTNSILIYKKISKNVYTEIQRVKNVETFNLKSSTDNASLIPRGRLFHFPTILFIKLNLNKLVLERLVKRFGVSILLIARSVNIPREPNPRIKGQANMIIKHPIKENNISNKSPILQLREFVVLSCILISYCLD